MKQEYESEENDIFQNINIIRLLKSAMHFWYIFAITITIALSSAFIYNRYATIIYNGSTTILLKEKEYSSQMQLELTEGFGLSSEMNNLENQKYIYSSPKIVERAIKNLDFFISYKRIGRIKDVPVFGRQVPIKINIDTLHDQTIDGKFIVKIDNIDGGSIRLKGESVWKYNYTTSEFTNDLAIENVDTTFSFKFGQKIESPLFAFEIERKTANTEFLMANELEFYFNTKEDLIARWRSSLFISLPKESGTVATVSAVSNNRYQLIAFLHGMNYAIENYNLEKKNEKATRTLKFIENQLLQTTDSLNKASEKLIEFRKRNNFAGRTLYADNLQKTYFNKEEELQTLKLQRDYYSNIRKSVNDKASLQDYFILGSTETTNPLIARTTQQLLEAQQELETMKYEKDSNPYKLKVAQSEKLLRSNLDALTKQAIERLDIKISDSEQLLKKMNVTADGLPNIEAEYTDLERSYKIFDAIYTFLLQKQSENEIAKASNTSDCEVLEEPGKAYIVSPKTQRNYAVALAAGVALPVLFVFLLEFINHNIRTSEDLQKLVPDIPLLGIIPRSSYNDDLICYNEPSRITSEAFRSLRVKLRFMARTEETGTSKTIMFSSCNSGEGKTYCAINTASVFALTGKRCLIMNFDLRCPRLESAIGITHRHVGIADYLANLATAEEITIKTELKNLSIMSSGTIPPNPAELIASDLTAKLMDYAKQNFDIIIIDTAPIGQISDCRLLEPYCDSFIFVVLANKTEYKHLLYTMATLKQENVKSLGFLFNGASASEKGYGNYGYYNRDCKYLKV